MTHKFLLCTWCIHCEYLSKLVDILLAWSSKFDKIRDGHTVKIQIHLVLAGADCASAAARLQNCWEEGKLPETGTRRVSMLRFFSQFLDVWSQMCGPLLHQGNHAARVTSLSLQASKTWEKDILRLTWDIPSAYCFQSQKRWTTWHHLNKKEWTILRTQLHKQTGSDIRRPQPSEPPARATFTAMVFKRGGSYFLTEFFSGYLSAHTKIADKYACSLRQNMMLTPCELTKHNNPYHLVIF